MPTIDPNKVVEYGPPAVQQLGKLAGACLKHWPGAPPEVRLEVGNAVAILNKVMIDEQHEAQQCNPESRGGGNAPDSSG